MYHQMPNKHVIKRGKTWYLRMKIPKEARPVFRDKQHIVKSLKTRDHAMACVKADIMAGRIRQLFEEAKGHEVKFLAADLQMKIVEKREKGENAQADIIHTAVAVNKRLGLDKAKELMERAFGVRHDLDHGEEHWFELGGFAERTKTGYRHALDLLRQYLQRENQPESVEAVDGEVAAGFRRFLMEMRAERKKGNKISRETANKHLSALKNRWAFFIDESIVTSNPWNDLRIKPPHRGYEPPRRPWENQELEVIFARPMRPELFNIVSLLLCTGARRGDILGLTKADILGNWIYIRQGKTSSAVRRVPIAPLLRKGIKKLCDDKENDAKLFTMSGNAVTLAFRKHTMECELKDAATVLHSLRHWFITTADTASLERHHVQTIVGHGGRKSITDLYTRVDDAKKVRIVTTVVSKIPNKIRREISLRFGTES